MTKGSRIPRISILAKGIVLLFLLQFVILGGILYIELQPDAWVWLIAWFGIEVSVGLTLVLVVFETARSTKRLSQVERNLASQVSRTRDTLYANDIARLVNAEMPMHWSNPYMLSAEALHLCLGHILGQENFVIVECGSGISTQVFGYALRQNGSGKVYSLEHDESFARISRVYIERCGLGEYVEVIYAPLTTYEINGSSYQWYDISDLPQNLSINFLTVDGPPGSIQENARYPALPLLKSRLSSMALIYVDDYSRRDEREMVRSWMSEVPGTLLDEYPYIPKGGALLSLSS